MLSSSLERRDMSRHRENNTLNAFKFLIVNVIATYLYSSRSCFESAPTYGDFALIGSARTYGNYVLIESVSTYCNFVLIGSAHIKLILV